jgi:hypothetical protein
LECIHEAPTFPFFRETAFSLAMKIVQLRKQKSG